VSVQAMSWVIEKSEHKSGNLVVLLMIANHAHSDGKGSWAGTATLAAESRMTRRQVQRCIRQLEKSGELRIEMNAGPRGTNLYSLPLMALDSDFHRGVKMSQGGGVIGDTGGRNPQQEGATPMSPEPSVKQPSVKQPKPRAQSRRARNRFDEEQEHRRRIAAQNRRLLGEESVAREIRVGQGPR
jgi:hypothetical protein